MACAEYPAYSAHPTAFVRLPPSSSHRLCSVCSHLTTWHCPHIRAQITPAFVACLLFCGPVNTLHLQVSDTLSHFGVRCAAVTASAAAAGRVESKQGMADRPVCFRYAQPGWGDTPVHLVPSVTTRHHCVALAEIPQAQHVQSHKKDHVMRCLFLHALPSVMAATIIRKPDLPAPPATAPGWVC